MASTGFWPVKGRLKDVIEYARNPEKTVLTDDLKQSPGYIVEHIPKVKDLLEKERQREHETYGPEKGKYKKKER